MRELIKQLNQFYIPPLSKLYYERIALEKVVFHSPLFVHISDPNSWLIQPAYCQLKILNPEQLKTKIDNIIRYLMAEDGGLVFEGNRLLTLNDSIPYIEWKDGEKFYALTDFLGKYSLFIDVSEFEGEGELENLKKTVNRLQSSLNPALQLFLINLPESVTEIEVQGILDGNAIILIQAENVTTHSFIERFNFKNRMRNGLALFNFGSKPYFMMDPNGKLVTFFGKQEQSLLVEEIKKTIQLKG